MADATPPPAEIVLMGLQSRQGGIFDTSAVVRVDNTTSSLDTRLHRNRSQGSRCLQGLQQSKGARGRAGSPNARPGRATAGYAGRRQRFPTWLEAGSRRGSCERTQSPPPGPSRGSPGRADPVSLLVAEGATWAGKGFSARGTRGSRAARVSHRSCTRSTPDTAPKHAQWTSVLTSWREWGTGSPLRRANTKAT